MPIEVGNLSLGSLACGIMGVFTGHLLSKIRTTNDRKISDFNKAAAEFLCAFTDELRMIDESNKDTYFPKIFNDGYVKHCNGY